MSPRRLVERGKHRPTGVPGVDGHVLPFPRTLRREADRLSLAASHVDRDAQRGYRQSQSGSRPVVTAPQDHDLADALTERVGPAEASSESVTNR